ncbi:MAG TPA: helix-turn-helix domain-containing protein [Actinomycetota bacterium]|nr:helix-turn-helix domain-containing protein [Actinomycetota bacterium]
MPQTKPVLGGKRQTSFARRLEAAAPKVAEEIGAAILEEVPAYRTLGEEAVKGVSEAARRNVTSFAKSLATGRVPSRRQVDELGAIGAERARQGIPLDEVLRAFRMVGRVMWDQVSREVNARVVSAEEAVELGRALMQFTDEIASAVARHYVAAQRELMHREEATRRDFAHDLLFGTHAGAGLMIERARSLGFDLGGPHVAFSALPPNKDRARATSDLEREFGRAVEQLATMIGPRATVVYAREGGYSGVVTIPPDSKYSPQTAGTQLSKLLSGWAIGVGEAYPGPEGSRRSWIEAQEALEIGSKVKPSEAVHLFSELMLQRFLLADRALAERFIDVVLGKLIEHDQRRKGNLIETLEAFFRADGSPKRAAEMVFAHPHTVSYRLKLVEKLTGRSLHDPDDKLQLNTALIAHQLSRQNAGDLG